MAKKGMKTNIADHAVFDTLKFAHQLSNQGHQISDKGPTQFRLPVAQYTKRTYF